MDFALAAFLRCQVSFNHARFSAATAICQHMSERHLAVHELGRRFVAHSLRPGRVVTSQ